MNKKMAKQWPKVRKNSRNSVPRPPLGLRPPAILARVIFPQRIQLQKGLPTVFLKFSFATAPYIFCRIQCDVQENIEVGGYSL